MSKLGKKALIMVAVQLISLVLLGGFLFKIQDTLSMEDTHADIEEKLSQMDTLHATAIESGEQVSASYDDVYQGKVNALALMVQRTTELTNAEMETYRELLNVDNVVVLDRYGNVTARAKVSPASYSRARFNRILNTLSYVDCEPFEVTYKTGTTYRYYAARIDATRIAVVEHKPEELDAMLADTSTWQSVLSNVSVGLDGFAFAVSAKTYNFLYYPNEELVGRDSLAHGIPVEELNPGNFCWMTLEGQRYYCGVTIVDDAYVICAIPQSEINASRNVTVYIVLFVFFLIVSVIITYAALLINREIRDGNEDAVRSTGKFYFDKAVARRIGSIAVIGLIGIVVISLFMQTLYSLSRHSMSNNQRVSEVEASIERYYEDSELVMTQYNRRYLNKAKTAAYILSKWPDLRTRENLETLSSAINVEWIMVFNQNGVSTVSNSPYGTFRLSTDPEDQSYPFRKLLNGAAYVIQDAAEDELSGTYIQYIGYQLLDADGNSDGFVQIAVTPTKLEEALASTSITSILDGITVGTDGFAFAVSADDYTFAYYPSDKLIGRSALDYGLTEEELCDGLCDYITVNDVSYYASSLEADGYYVFVVVPADEVTANRWPVTISIAIFSAICLLIIFLLLTLRRTALPGDEAAEKASPDDQNSRMIDVKLTDGSIKKTESVDSRWSGLGIAWNEKTPEQQVASIMRVFISLFAFAICFALVFNKDFFDENSIFMYIISGKWSRGVNIFSVTASLMLICVIYVFTMLIRGLLKFLGKALDTRGDTICRLLRSFIKYVAVIAAMYYCLAMFGVDTATLLASAGILSLVVGLGAKDLITDIIAGLFIIFEGEFRVGDIVTVGGWRGTVQEIGVRTTKIEDGAKNVKILSNRDVNGIINMTRKYSFAVCNVGIEYGESLERVENVLAKELPKFKKRLPAIESGPFYKGVVSLGDNSVNIRIVAECAESARFQLERDLNREIKLLFDNNNINIPFPQVVVNQPPVFDGDDATYLEKRRADAFNKQQADLSKDIVADTGNPAN